MGRLVSHSLILLALLLAGCGSGGSEQTATADTSADDTSDDSSGDDDEPTETETEADSAESADPWADYTSPIQDFLGVDYANFDQEDAQAQFAEQEREVQEKVTECMRALGWEYTPVSQDASISFGFDPFEADGLEYGSAEWVEKWGLGITTQAFSQSMVGPDLVGYDDAQDQAFEEQMEDSNDPNDAYVQSLSESETEAYFSDLYGAPPEFDDTLTDEEQEEFWSNFEPTGCQSAAYDGFGFGNEGEQQFYEAFGPELEELYERVQADPRVIAERTDFVDCLTKEGHQISSDTDPQQQFYEMFETEMESLYQDSGQFEDPFDGLDPESMSEEEINEILEQFDAGGGPQLSPEQLGVLADLQEREFDLAKDVLACEPEFFTGGGQSEIFFEVITELEQEFLDANAGALAEFEGIGAE